MTRELHRFLAFAIALPLLAFSHTVKAADCYQASVTRPAPFLGNNDEVFQLSDGSIWQVKFEYEYLYEYYPDVVICPARGVLLIDGKSLNVIPLRGGRGNATQPPANALTVVYRIRGCDYFVADGPSGLYVLEWYGGYDPSVGDTLVGYERGYGMKTVTYLRNGREGRIWAEDYLLSSKRAAAVLSDKCS